MPRWFAFAALLLALAPGAAAPPVVAAPPTTAPAGNLAKWQSLFGSPEADVFQVVGGQGSAAIYGFQPGWDQIVLTGHPELADWSALAALARQRDKDVVWHFANGEELHLQGLTLAQLGPADFNFPPPRAVPAGWRLLDRPAAQVNVNGIYALNNPWGIGKLAWGREVSMSIAYDPANLVHNTVIDWHAPVLGTYAWQVLGFPELVIGVNPYNTLHRNPGDAAQVLPVRLGDLSGLTVNHDLAWQGALAFCDVAWDIWLTHGFAGDNHAISNEVMVWVHQGRYTPPGKLVGSWTSADGHTARIWHQQAYTAVVFDHDFPRGSIDLGALLGHLRRLRFLNNDEYLGSVELGPEMVSGSGRLTVHGLSYRIVSRNRTGGETVKEIDGTGSRIVSGH